VICPLSFLDWGYTLSSKVLQGVGFKGLREAVQADGGIPLDEIAVDITKLI
jgi:hypothetical protein